MSAREYRVLTLILFAILVAGLLTIGYFLAQNGRYAQHGANVIDTRTGTIFPPREGTLDNSVDFREPERVERLEPGVSSDFPRPNN